MHPGLVFLILRFPDCHIYVLTVDTSLFKEESETDLSSGGMLIFCCPNSSSSYKKSSYKNIV